MAKKKARRKPVKKFIPQSPISDEIYLPNHSGMLDAGKVHRTPTDGLDPVNKKYVDDNIPSNIHLFFTENTSDIGGYFDVEVDPVTDTEENTLTAIPGNSTGTLMASYATILNDAVISGIVELEIGVYKIHVHAEASKTGVLSMYAEIYHRAGITETLLLTSEDSDLLTTTKGSIEFHGTLSTEKEWASTDRIVIKLYGKNNSPTSRNLTYYIEGDTSSRAELPAVRPTPITFPISRVYARKNAVQVISNNTHTRVADWVEIHDNLGEFNTTSGRFTAQETGYYFIRAVITFLSAAWQANEHIILLVYKEEAVYHMMSRNTISDDLTGIRSLNGSAIVQLNAGQTMYLDVIHIRGATATITSSGRDTNLSIHRLS